VPAMDMLFPGEIIELILEKLFHIPGSDHWTTDLIEKNTRQFRMRMRSLLHVRQTSKTMDGWVRQMKVWRTMSIGTNGWHKNRGSQNTTTASITRILNEIMGANVLKNDSPVKTIRSHDPSEGTKDEAGPCVAIPKMRPIKNTMLFVKFIREAVNDTDFSYPNFMRLLEFNEHAWVSYLNPIIIDMVKDIKVTQKPIEAALEKFIQSREANTITRKDDGNASNEKDEDSLADAYIKKCVMLTDVASSIADVMNFENKYNYNMWLWYTDMLTGKKMEKESVPRCTPVGPEKVNDASTCD
jgi:hypothetical protein